MERIRPPGLQIGALLPERAFQCLRKAIPSSWTVVACHSTSDTFSQALRAEGGILVVDVAAIPLTEYERVLDAIVHSRCRRIILWSALTTENVGRIYDIASRIPVEVVLHRGDDSLVQMDRVLARGGSNETCLALLLHLLAPHLRHLSARVRAVALCAFDASVSRRKVTACLVVPVSSSTIAREFRRWGLVGLGRLLDVVQVARDRDVMLAHSWSSHRSIEQLGLEAGRERAQTIFAQHRKLLDLTPSHSLTDLSTAEYAAKLAKNVLSQGRGSIGSR